uniref:EGF-like domain-containing protein n=1 Tax=Steinernema glaseri TaxID=37863 RepID=A0A1I8A9M3_9BILA
MKYLIIFGLIAESAWAQQRHKDTDELGQKLVNYSSIPPSCGSDSYFGYGVIDGSLEKCDKYNQLLNDEDPAVRKQYESYKCQSLRVHASLSPSGHCECQKSWKGPLCEQYIGCPQGFSLYQAVCTPNLCQHEGVMAVGSKQIECVCKAPWDGRFCDRLACWRMAPKEHERRWRNAGDTCRCAEGYAGDNCDQIVHCKHGTLSGGRCECPEGWKGELCEKKCIPNQTCFAPSLALSSVLLLLPACLALRNFF